MKTSFILKFPKQYDLAATSVENIIGEFLDFQTEQSRVIVFSPNEEINVFKTVSLATDYIIIERKEDVSSLKIYELRNDRPLSKNVIVLLKEFNEGYKETKGDLVELVFDGKFDVITHGCNCFNKMNGGLSLQMKEKFGCDTFPKENLIGEKLKLGTIDYKQIETSLQ